jgi:hypothetical protein
MHLQDSLYLEERDLSGHLEEVSEDAFAYLEERDLSGDLEEVSEDAFSRQSVPGRKRSLWRS